MIATLFNGMSLLMAMPVSPATILYSASTSLPECIKAARRPYLCGATEKQAIRAYTQLYFYITAYTAMKVAVCPIKGPQTM